MKRYFLLAILFAVGGQLIGQTLTQTIRGNVQDAITAEQLFGATIILSNIEPLVGTTTDIDGNFILEHVPIGRQSIEVSYLGYETYIAEELLISAGKETVLNIKLNTGGETLNEAVVVAKRSKAAPINTMSSLSARQFTVEEAQRYAGGLDDPARLASSFAGVSTPTVSSNGISVRGNNPHGLLWRIEGVEVPNPNHFANLTVAGGGVLTVISNQMMANSDFFSGAFPAEYGNASSGVFDINLKKGNSSTREYTFQAGLLGIDFATEGPFKKGKKASYAFNYRYSTLGLLAPFLPEDAGVIKYQDLTFKTVFPTKNAGEITVWGVGGLDRVQMNALDSAAWQADFDRETADDKLFLFATGVSHKMQLNQKSILNTTLSTSGSGFEHDEEKIDFNLQAQPFSNINNLTFKHSIQSILNHRFGDKHINRSGFYLNQIGYKFEMYKSLEEGEAPQRIIDANGQAFHLQAFTQSKFYLTNNLIINAGVHYQHFFLNDNYSIEPRIGLKYTINENQSIGLAYGLHSRLEIFPVYFVEKNEEAVNKNLKFMQSAHYVLSYNLKLSEYLRLIVEPYYQRLHNVPVSPTNYISTLNIENNIFFTEELVGSGSGKNMGVDITLERFLKNGAYYLLTASLFDSKYTGADEIERNTRFNKNYVFNILVGKEWSIGKKKNDILSANLRLNYAGGNRMEPIDESASLKVQEIIYAETVANKAYAQQFDDLPVVSFTFSYIRNKPKHTSTWSIKVLNASSTKEFVTDFYNLKTNNLDQKFDGIVIPNLSYKIEF